jgi:hypothetical protein
MTPNTVAVILAALGAWFIVTNIDMFLHARYGGSMKRGVKVWSEILPKDMKRFLAVPQK